MAGEDGGGGGWLQRKRKVKIRMASRNPCRQTDVTHGTAEIAKTRKKRPTRAMTLRMYIRTHLFLWGTRERYKYSVQHSWRAVRNTAAHSQQEGTSRSAAWLCVARLGPIKPGYTRLYSVTSRRLTLCSGSDHDALALTSANWHGTRSA